MGLISELDRKMLEQPGPHSGDQWQCPSWRPVASNVPLGSVMFNIFISDLDDKAKCIFRKVADDTKLEAVADIAEDHAAIQKALHS